MFSKYFNFKWFLLSFSIGIFYIYLTDDYKKVIVVYPTPINSDDNVYLDKSDNCFKYRLNERKCPDDASKLVNVGVNY